MKEVPLSKYESRDNLAPFEKQIVLVEGTVNNTREALSGNYGICLTDCRISLWGTGKPQEIDHIWIFVDEEYSFSCKDGKCSVKELDLTKGYKLNCSAVVRKYFRKSINNYDYGIRILQISNADFVELFNLGQSLERVLEAIDVTVEKTKRRLTNSQRKKFERIFKKNIKHFTLNKLFENIVHGYIPSSKGPISIVDFFKHLRDVLHTGEAVFPPETTSKELLDAVSEVEALYFRVYKHYEKVEAMSKFTVKEHKGFGSTNNPSMSLRMA